MNRDASNARRISCPRDIIGTQIVSEDEKGHRFLRFEKGPVFANILLVDEVNRATPKTQAALLEVMQEHGVTVGGERHALPEPFFVLATQNPMEMEGTYPLPEAQLDRFLFKIRVPFPDQKQLVEISRRTTGFEERTVEPVMRSQELLAYQEALTYVPVADPITEYAAKVVLATHGDQPGSGERIKRYVAYGSSPRGMQALIRAGRVYAALDGSTAVGEKHIRRAAKTSLRHRIILNFEGEAEQLDVDHLVDELIAGVPTTAEKKAA